MKPLIIFLLLRQADHRFAMSTTDTIMVHVRVNSLLTYARCVRLWHWTRTKLSDPWEVRTDAAEFLHFQTGQPLYPDSSHYRLVIKQ